MKKPQMKEKEVVQIDAPEKIADNLTMSLAMMKDEEARRYE